MAADPSSGLKPAPATSTFTSVLSLKFVKEIILSLVSGHDFSRAVNGAKLMGFSP